MINTGATLRRPFESSYAIFRRGLIANNGCSIAVLQRLARSTYEAQSIVDAWRSIELERQLPDVSRTVATLEPRKNCVYCAGMGYHTAMFDLPWVTRCPLHQAPLTPRCPACRFPWPAPKDLQKRDCNVCGTRIPSNVLAERGAFNDSLDFSSLECAYGGIEKTAFQSQITLTSNRPVAHAHRSQININNPFCPAVISSNRPDIADALHQLGVEIPSSHLMTGKLIPLVEQIPTTNLWGDPIVNWEIAARFRVLRIIQRSIAANTAPAHYVGLVPEHLDSIDTNYCGFCLAFSLWYSIIAHRPNCMSPAETPEFGRNIFPSSFVRMYPYAPCALSQVKQNENRYRMQLQLQRHLYTVDLWTTFIHIASFLNACYGLSHQKPMLLNDFLDGLSYPAALGSELSPLIGFRIEDNNELSIIASSEVALPGTILPHFEHFDVAKCPNRRVKLHDRHGNLNLSFRQKLAWRLHKHQS